MKKKKSFSKASKVPNLAWHHHYGALKVQSQQFPVNKPWPQRFSNSDQNISLFLSPTNQPTNPFPSRLVGAECGSIDWVNGKRCLLALHWSSHQRRLLPNHWSGGGMKPAHPELTAVQGRSKRCWWQRKLSNWRVQMPTENKFERDELWKIISFLATLQNKMNQLLATWNTV